MFNVFNHLLVCLCLADMIVILTNISFVLRSVFPHIVFFSTIAPISDSFCHIAVATSVFFTISITIERYYACKSPFNYHSREQSHGHWLIVGSYVLPSIVAAVIFNIPKLLQLADILVVENIPTEYQTHFVKIGIIYQVFHPLTTTCIIPFFILGSLNYSIYKSSRRLNVTPYRDISLENILMSLVVVFIILSIPKMFLALQEVSIIPDILDCLDRKCGYHISSNRWIADITIRYLALLNSSINFIIYCFVGSNFRNTLMMSIKSIICKSTPGSPKPPKLIAESHNPPHISSNDTQTRSNLLSDCIENAEDVKHYLETDF